MSVISDKIYFTGLNFRIEWSCFNSKRRIDYAQKSTLIHILEW